MKTQEVVTLITELPIEFKEKGGTVVKMYPELDPLFEKGMYIESLTQTYISNKTYLITLVFRHYNVSQSN